MKMAVDWVRVGTCWLLRPLLRGALALLDKWCGPEKGPQFYDDGKGS